MIEIKKPFHEMHPDHPLVLAYGTIDNVRKNLKEKFGIDEMKTKYIISRYNHDIEWIKEYVRLDTNDLIMYDRSDVPIKGAIVVPNVGSDIYDKFTYIIDNYDNLPGVAVYAKANLFQYITKEEFDAVKDNKVFTPLLTQHHKTYLPVCWYEGGMYCERNDFWYLNNYPHQKAQELIDFLGIRNKEYLTFAPGSNYIIPKENILKHSKEFYIKLRSYLAWAVYPAEAQIIERCLYMIFK